MEVLVATPRGFCAGVVRAIRIVELALEKYGPPVYVKHPVVHNEHVVSRLEAMGAVTVDSVGEIPRGATAIFSAHGSPPGDLAEAQERGLNLVDAVCPLVTKVHNEVKKYGQQGRIIAVVGHEHHVEFEGTLGHAMAGGFDTFTVDPDKAGSEEFLDLVSALAAAKDATEVAVVTQTTLSKDDVAPAVAAIRRRFPNAVVRDDICYATTNRQEAVKLLAQQVDLILVVGSPTSSNCQRLVETAVRQGTPAHLVQGPWDMPGESVLKNVERVGVTSGASTPEELVQSVIEQLQPDQVRQLEGPEEDITFTLPEELRDVAAALD